MRAKHSWSFPSGALLFRVIDPRASSCVSVIAALQVYQQRLPQCDLRLMLPLDKSRMAAKYKAGYDDDITEAPANYETSTRNKKQWDEKEHTLLDSSNGLQQLHKNRKLQALKND